MASSSQKPSERRVDLDWIRIAAFAILVPALVALASCGSGSGGSAMNAPAAVPPFVSQPDCVGPANMVAEAAPAPTNATYLRVQHIGDPGTAELAGEIANRINWSVGDYTGFYPADTADQRGFRDAGPPIAASAFQLSCNGAGIFINTWQFSHAAPLVGEGPSASLARDFAPAPMLFRDPASTATMEARIHLKHANYQAPHVADGTAQLSFFAYFQDATSGTVFAQLVALFDSRPSGAADTGSESIGSDGVVAFVSSPLLATDAAGRPLQFVSVGPSSALMRNELPWGEPLLFRAQVPYDKFRALLTRLKSGPLPAISPRPEDYRLLSFGVLGEVFPGTGNEHNVAIGASVFGMRIAGE